jgi:hypothetical protein
MEGCSIKVVAEIETIADLAQRILDEVAILEVLCSGTMAASVDRADKADVAGCR